MAKTPDEYAALAAENFETGINCAQAVLCAFADDIGLDRSTASKIASSFGGGMAHGEFCGALTGTFIACGYAFGFDESMAQNSASIATLKEEQSKKTKTLTKQFSDKYGSYNCKHLLEKAGEDRRAYCKTLVAEAARNFANMLEQEKQ